MKIAYCKTNLEASGYVVHGLGLLAALGERYGHTSRWINVSCPPAHPRDWLAAERPDVLAITACSDAFPAAVDTARFAKEVNPGLTVFIGGPHATFAPGDFAAHPQFDWIVQGEGEELWAAFCRGESLEPWRSAPADPRILHGTSPADLDALPFVQRHQERAFDVDSEAPPLPLHGWPGPYRCVLAGRGCRYNCKFCKPGTDLLFGKKTRRRSPGKVLEELRGLAPFGALFIHDDNLLEDEPWVDAFLAGWDGRPFLCQGRADLMVRHAGLLERMVGGGLRCMLVGFESGSDATLRRMRKGTTRKLNEEAAALGHRLGISMQANMIFGTPGETKEDVEASLTLIREHLQPCTLSPAIYTPYPGSAWGEEMNLHGWNRAAQTYSYGRGLGGRQIDEAALGYSYDWLYERLRQG